VYNSGTRKLPSELFIPLAQPYPLGRFCKHALARAYVIKGRPRLLKIELSRPRHSSPSNFNPSLGGKTGV
jgi:hypothetical protein